MNQLILFSSNHPILVIAIIVVTLMLIYSFIGDKFRGFSSVSTTESTQLINREDAVIVDVRENNEYSKGHIVNSVHIPLASFKQRITELEKYKDKPIIVACRSGHRSAQACSDLKKAGFENIHNLSGGIMAWETANLPLTKR